MIIKDKRTKEVKKRVHKIIKEFEKLSDLEMAECLEYQSRILIYEISKHQRVI